MTDVSRSGRPNSPRNLVVQLGIVAGFVAPAMLAIFLVVAQWRTDHSNLHEVMSALGDSYGDGWGLAFELVQYATAVLLALFAFAFWKLVPSGRIIVILIAINALATVALGQARCRDISSECAGPTISLVPAVRDQHGLITIVLGATIVLVLVAAVVDLRRTGPFGFLPKISAPFLVVAVLGAGAVGLIQWQARQCPVVPDSVEYVRKFRVNEDCRIKVRTSDGTLEDLDREPRWVGLAERAVWVGGYGWLITASVLMLRQQRSRRLVRFDVRLLQENVAYGSASRPYGWYRTAAITDVEGFRRWLAAAVSSKLIRPEQPRPRPVDDAGRPYTISLAVSRIGLKTLGIDYRWRTPMIDDAFGIGMEGRFEHLGDDPDTTALDKADILIWVTAKSEADLAKATTALAELNRFIREATTITAQPGQLAQGTEPFGFVDGISNPWVRGLHDPADLRRAGGGKVTDRGFQQIALGEFILGQVDEADDVMPLPEPANLFRNGTFLVIRQLDQETDRYWAAAGALAAGDSEEARALAGAKLMGRRRDGTPLATADDGPLGNNQFLFGDDPEGLRCPVDAHIRRANPRDSLGFDGVPVHRRRIIRRGLPYHRPARGGGLGVEQGLVFVCLNARPADQFDFIQHAWLNEGESFRLGRSPDPVAGTWADDCPRTIRVPGQDGPRFARLGRPLVTTICGGYFFLPSIAGLRYLAGAEPPAARKGRVSGRGLRQDRLR